jgi:hypothetical protein
MKPEELLERDQRETPTGIKVADDKIEEFIEEVGNILDLARTSLAPVSMGFTAKEWTEYRLRKVAHELHMLKIDMEEYYGA